jgi:hypothetical protein
VEGLDIERGNRLWAFLHSLSRGQAAPERSKSVRKQAAAKQFLPNFLSQFQWIEPFHTMGEGKKSKFFEKAR